jgi:hypothetical protein
VEGVGGYGWRRVVECAGVCAALVPIVQLPLTEQNKKR